MTILLRTSKGFALFLISTHLLAMAVLTLSQLAFVYLCVGCVILMGSGLWAIDAWRQSKLITHLYFDDTQSRLVCKDQSYNVETTEPQLLLSWLVVIRLTAADNAWTVAVFPDSCDREDFRKLKVWFRCKHQSVQSQ